MRQGIETAPKDGTIVILEDDASGTYDVAHWSAEATRWLGENGEPSKIAPTHWHHQRPCDQYFPEEDERQPRRFAAFPIVAVGLLGMGLMSLYFEAFDSATILPRQDLHKTDQRAEADRVREKKEGTRPQQAVEALPREARQSVTTVQSTESSLTNELAENRRAIDGLDRQFHAEEANAAQSIEQDQQRVILARVDIAARQKLSPGAEQDRQALEEERARSLRSEVAPARREVEAQAAQLRKFSDEAAQLKQAEAAKSAQSIEEERKRAAGLALEAAAAQQELTASTEQHRQALEEERARSAALTSELTAVQREITRTVQSQKAVDAATKQIQAAESTIAELRQSLQQEQKKTAALMEEAKAAQAMTTAAEPQRRALEEAHARAATLASELDASKKQKQAAEATAAELQKSLQQERDKTEAMARDFATVRRTMDGRVTVGRSAESHPAQVRK